MKPILTPQASISHFMTYGEPEFNKMIQKNSILTCIIFLLVLVGGKIKRPGQLATRVEDNQGGRGQD